MSNNSNYCPEVYRSLFVDRFNDTGIRVAPCCQAERVVESVDTFDFNTSPYLTQLREKFNQGERPTECHRCWRVEDLGHESRRQSTIKFFNTTSREIKLESLDHSTTWACNLACVPCGPYNSSTWATELNLNHSELANLGRKFQKHNEFKDQLDYQHIRKLHFNGGEPLLNNEQLLILEKLDKQQVLNQTTISYNTNGTIMPTDRLIEFWKKAKLVKLFFSIDAIGEAFDYIRYPAQWTEVSNNLISMKNNLPGNVLFGFQVTVGCHNVFEIMNVWNWFRENLAFNREGDPSDFCWQLPTVFDMRDLPTPAKQKAIVELESVKEFEGIVNYLKSTINYSANNDWQLRLDGIDQRRHTNWRKSLKVSKYYKETTC